MIFKQEGYTRKQLLLSQQSSMRQVFLNKIGLTPSKVVLQDCGKRDFEEIQRASSALYAKHLQALVVLVQDLSNDQSNSANKGPTSI